MITEQKVFNDLIETIVKNSENNIATITNVKLWAKSWQTEMEQELTLTSVVASLPSRDTVICEGYNKAKNEDYKNRNSLRHKSQDDYYSGWMDSYDFISKSKG
jgi:molybdopterin-guanine dinucleotide biosynthesis protein